MNNTGNYPTIPIITLKNGFSMPILGFGTWKMGQVTTYGSSETDVDSIKTIQAAVEHGIVHIDTAELYGDGYVEEMLGEALKNVERSKLFITSKVKGQSATKAGIRNAITRSLKRLNTEYLDLYLIHYRDLNLPVEEGILAMNDLIDEGLIRNLGVSNFNVDSMQKSLAVTKHPVAVNQVQYNLQHREAEANGVLEFCQKNDIILEAWGPVRPINKETIDIPVIKEICDKYSASPHQVAINWLISQLNVTTLFKTNHVERMQENLASLSWKMEIEDVERLRREFPGQVYEFPNFPMK